MMEISPRRTRGGSGASGSSSEHAPAFYEVLGPELVESLVLARLDARSLVRVSACCKAFRSLGSPGNSLRLVERVAQAAVLECCGGNVEAATRWRCALDCVHGWAGTVVSLCMEAVAVIGAQQWPAGGLHELDLLSASAARGAALLLWFAFDCTHCHSLLTHPTPHTHHQHTRRNMGWLERLYIEDSAAGFDRRWEVKKKDDPDTDTSPGFKFAPEPATRVPQILLMGMGPKLLLSDVSTEQQPVLRWRLVVRGNTAVEFGVVPANLQVRLPLRRAFGRRCHCTSLAGSCMRLADVDAAAAGSNCLRGVVLTPCLPSSAAQPPLDRSPHSNTTTPPHPPPPSPPQYGGVPDDEQSKVHKALHKCKHPDGAEFRENVGFSSAITVGSMLPFKVPLMKGSVVEVLTTRGRFEFLVINPPDAQELFWQGAGHHARTVPKPYKGPQRFSMEQHFDATQHVRLALTCWAQGVFDVLEPAPRELGGSCRAPAAGAAAVPEAARSDDSGSSVPSGMRNQIFGMEEM